MNKKLISREEILGGMVVAIDGPAGSGKSTTARLVSRRLGYRHIDTGAMYRAVALAVLRRGADPGDEAACGGTASALAIRFEESNGGQRVVVNGEDVSEEIRSPEVTRAVSPVSAHPSVRVAMVRQQRALARAGGAVLEGRDIGTVVIPAAEVKVHLVASTRVRAERRLKELRDRGTESTLEEVERDIIRRDEYDSNRGVSPLRRAVGSVEVDTSELTIDGQVDRIVGIAHDTAERLVALEPAAGSTTYRRTRAHYGVGCILIKGVLKLLFGLKIERKSNVDFKENYIFACNHKSYADPPFVGSTLHREVYFMAKSALFRNPLFAWLIRTFNALPLRRGVFDRDAMNRVVNLLAEGASLMIFPEGSRVRADRLGKARSGVGYLAVQSGTAVVPVYVSGTEQLGRCLLRRRRLYVVIGKPIRLAPQSRDTFANGDGYRAFADMVLEAISQLKSDHEGPAEVGSA